MVGGVFSASGTIREVHQNSQEVLRETWVRFIIYGPTGIAAFDYNKMAASLIANPLSYQQFGFIFMQHFQLVLSEKFLSFLECKPSHKCTSPMAPMW